MVPTERGRQGKAARQREIRGQSQQNSDHPEEHFKKWQLLSPGWQKRQEKQDGEPGLGN